ncbi:2-amino-4-hydroxy-6-hydroxymethyldihydropteridine diphosphokinase [Elusimicrobiota bacterium]
MGDIVVLSLGSNLGDRENNIKAAVKLLEEKFNTKLKKSPVYETPPLYHTNSGYYYNCCVSFETDYEPEKIFKSVNSIEKELKRKRKEPNAPRTIDIDIIFIGEKIIATDKLTVPHPGMQDRLFVLQPLSDILANFVHPAMQLKVTDLLHECIDISVLKEIKGFWNKK